MSKKVKTANDLLKEVIAGTKRQAFKDEAVSLIKAAQKAAADNDTETLLKAIKYINTPKYDRFDDDFHVWALGIIQRTIPAGKRQDADFLSRAQEKYLTTLNSIDLTLDKPKIAAFIKRITQSAIKDQYRDNDPVMRDTRSLMKEAVALGLPESDCFTEAVVKSFNSKADEKARKNKLKGHPRKINFEGLAKRSDIRGSAPLASFSVDVADVTVTGPAAGEESSVLNEEQHKVVENALSKAISDLPEIDMLLIAIAANEGLSKEEMAKFYKCAAVSSKCLKNESKQMKTSTSVNLHVERIEKDLKETLKETLMEALAEVA